MTDRCPTCGQAMPPVPSATATLLTADALVAAMRKPPPPPPAKGKYARGQTRDVYESADKTNTKRGSGRYFVTYGGGETTREAVDEALRRGLIRLHQHASDGYWGLV